MWSLLPLFSFASLHWLPLVLPSFSVWIAGGGIRVQVEMSLTHQCCYDLVSIRRAGFLSEPLTLGLTYCDL